MHKFPRTPHLAGSRLQPGDEDLPIAPLHVLAGRTVVVAEKVDGANTGISFSDDGRLHLQSRGHFLVGGPRERQFELLKSWAAAHQHALCAGLGSRYVLYGEWLYALHTVFYDALPHCFLAFDLLDTHTMRFLSTPRRMALLDGLPVESVPVLWSGVLPDPARLPALLGPSHFKTAAWRQRLAEACIHAHVDPERVRRETDDSDQMEGLYVKVEDEEHVLERYKFVRGSFRASVDQSGDDWRDRPLLRNQLRAGVDLFGQ